MRRELTVARELLGKVVCRRADDGRMIREVITETEAYGGEEDKASHVSKDRTKRTEVVYAEGGKVYVYLIYGMYWMLNVIIGREGSPQMWSLLIPRGAVPNALRECGDRKGQK